MTTKVPMPVSGNPATKGKPDGVSGAPGGDVDQVHGRKGAGESSGGAYPSPHRGKRTKTDGFLGHGGQTEIDYHGGGQAEDEEASTPNAATGSSGGRNEPKSALQSEDANAQGPSVHETAHGIQVVEMSGVAEAESTGKVATDAPYEEEQENPGSG